MSSVHTTASRPRQNRTSTILLVVGAAVLAAGVVVFVLKLTSGSSSTTNQQATHVPKAAKPTIPPKPPAAAHVKYSQLPADLRATVQKFVLTAVARKNTGASWDITTPGLRQGMGKKAWAKGDIPVQYFPVYKFGDSHFRVKTKTPNEILVRIGMQATPKSGLRATTFDLGVHKFGKAPNVHWKVDYWMPYYATPLPMAGNSGGGA